jgi:hypothetical protein
MNVPKSRSFASLAASFFLRSSTCLTWSPPLAPAPIYSKRINERRNEMIHWAHRLLQFCVFFLGVDEVEHDGECASEDEGEKEAETCQVCVSLGAIT